jgi:hypothetical protein
MRQKTGEVDSSGSEREKFTRVNERYTKRTSGVLTHSNDTQLTSLFILRLNLVRNSAPAPPVHARRRHLFFAVDRLSGDVGRDGFPTGTRTRILRSCFELGKRKRER